MNSLKKIKKRQRLRLTNYRKRLALLKIRRARLVLRKTNHYIICQLIDWKPDGDRVFLQLNTRQLAIEGSKKNINAAKELAMVFNNTFNFDQKLVLDTGYHRFTTNGFIDTFIKNIKTKDIF